MAEQQILHTQMVFSDQQPVKYNDIYLRLTACLIASHVIIVYGEKKSVFEILLTSGYYASLIGSAVIAFILVSIVRKVCLQLDRKFDWKQHATERAGLQFFFGLVIPGLLAFMLAAGYFSLHHMNIFNTSYLRYDFQFILAQLLLTNLYYVTYYFYVRWSQAEEALNSISERISVAKDNLIKDTFQVAKGASNILLPIDEIAYCYRDGDSNFLRTFVGEDFFIPQSLDEVQQQLPERKFFRANRQVIIHRKACKGYDLLSYGKLKAQLRPSYDKDAVISQKRSLAFRNWVESVN